MTHIPALLDLFVFSDNSICSAMGFPSLENSYDVAVLISFDFPSNSKGDDLFDFIDYDYFHADQS